tara:strand:+ start:378 stop:602 length:225 start_codon:yes stop_codon:yes gene_type:complete
LTHDWAVDRIHTLCQSPVNAPFIEGRHRSMSVERIENVENAYAIKQEFSEWLNPDIDDHDVFSLAYIGDDDFMP